MKRIVGIVGSVSVVMLLVASGCSTLPDSSAAALRGKWVGREMGNAPETPRELVFSANKVEYRGASPNDWGKGSFTFLEGTQPKQLLVTLTECGMPQYMGKTCYMIYEINNSTLTVAANEPGSPAAPLGFEAPHARHMVFKKE